MAFRLIFESDGDEIRLARKTRVDMVAPASPTDIEERGPGVWAEVRDHLDQTIYRANISGHFADTIETFAPNAPIQRVEAPDQKRIIMLVVPDPPEARSLVVIRRGGEAPAPTEGRLRPQALASDQELVRVALDED